jgi:hypothetical protein
MSHILEKLRGGDRRSIGRSHEVVKNVLRTPALLPDLFEGISDADPLVRLRAADAVEKATRAHPEWLQRWKRRLFSIASTATEKEVRWHVVQMLPRLRMTPRERRRVARILIGYLADESSIVKACSMQALVEFSALDARLRAQITPLIERLTRVGTPAMRARGRKLLKDLQNPKRRMGHARLGPREVARHALAALPSCFESTRPEVSPSVPRFTSRPLHHPFDGQSRPGRLP